METPQNFLITNPEIMDIKDEIKDWLLDVAFIAVITVIFLFVFSPLFCLIVWWGNVAIFTTYHIINNS